MAKFLAIKKLSALYPVDASGEAIMRSIKQGEIVEISLRRPRNVQHHRLFWALMTLVWENIENTEYPTVEDLVTRVKIETGHRHRIEFEGGLVAFVPKSIAFHNMSQDEFSAFFERVCDWIAVNVLPGVTKEDLQQEIETMTGIRD